MFNYIAEGQMNLMDFLEPEVVVIDERSPGLKVGTRIYMVTLDVVDSGIIDKYWWGCEDYGYSTDTNITFWDSYIGESVFTSKETAYSKAESQRDIYKVIRTKDMKIIKERNFVEICDDSRICISATVKLLKGNMVYWNEWYSYHFLDVCKSEKEAKKCYEEHLKSIQRWTKPPTRFEVNIPVELNDMYLCANGNWSEYDYASHNGPVRV